MTQNRWNWYPLEKLGIRREKQKVATRDHECTKLCCHHMAAIKITIKVVVMFENAYKQMVLVSAFDKNWFPKSQQQGCAQGTEQTGLALIVTVGFAGDQEEARKSILCKY